jgi:hypothetical protein
MGKLAAAHRAVKALGVGAGAACLAVLTAGLAALAGLTQAALVILGVAVAGLIALLLISLFVTDQNPTVRLAAKASAWGLAALLIAFLALAASATGLRWPPMSASLLGIEDGVVCGRPGELLQAFSCGGGEGSYVVVNIRVDDADSGLMVREGPGLQSIGRPIPANATSVDVPHPTCHEVGTVPPQSRDVIAHGCQRSPTDVTTWCRITFGGKSGWVLDGFLERQN